MKKLFASHNLVQLEIIKSRLESEHILCTIKNNFPPAAGEVPPMAAWPELWILDQQDYDRAQEILATELEQEAASNTNSWKCPHCHEHLNAQFKICWRCGYSKEE